MVKFIFDTDLGGDCDDAGALALAHNLMNLGKCEMLGATACSSATYSATAIQCMNEWFGRGDIPVGKNDTKPFLEEFEFNRYAKPIAEDYLQSHPMPKIESATRLMRKILAENHKVALVSIGMLNNIADLLRSEPDDISDLSGVELVREHVTALYAMAGDFGDLEHNEWNVALDVESAQYVADNFPCPIVYSGFELGMNINTGRRLCDSGTDNPFYRAYKIVSDFFRAAEPVRDSWDPLTVYAAVITDTPYLEKSEPITVNFDEIGRVVMTPGGKDCYLKPTCTKAEICDIIDDLMVV